MKKLKMRSKDITKENVEKIGKLFPNVITEIKDEDGNITHAIDFELLQQELSDEIVEGSKERYQLTWPGKKEAVVRANTPIDKTLRPVKEDSVSWEDTENLYIEGDNLEVLKLLQESYLNKIKCIYIDPPYNTGKDFIYKDNFTQDKDEYAEESGQVDEDGNRLFQNTEYNGRFHSDWLTMMYPRLKLARNLLSEDGVIFISIDDNEVHNLRKICDEIFGERNFVATVVWERAYAPVNLKKHFSENHDYMVSYAKNIDQLVCNGLERSGEADKRYKNPDNDPRGPWKSSDLSVGPIVPEKVYEITTPSGRKVLPPEGYCWRYTKERFEEMVKDNRIWFGEDGNNVPSIKRFLSEVKSTMTPLTIWKYEEVGHSQEAKQELNKLFDGKAFYDYPKSVKLIKRVIELYTSNDCFILDFFSGSATTAHAVMELNAEDGGGRKYIMVQLPEPCDEKSEAYKAGFKNIAEIGKERIRRAGKKIKEETGADIDYGFRVYRVDSSNMKDVYYRPDELDQNLLDQLESNIKEDRTGLDLLTQVMLEAGLELSLPIETKKIYGKEVHFVAGDSLVACFDEDVDEKLVKEIAKTKPLKVVFRDNSFKSCPDRINLEEIFKAISPGTEIKVL
ncbi:site-specific DNA-methyltransferase [Tepidanaerobacter syntrophicus]|uniref:Adenine-specific DNA-methyltransferase n=1 Tax=Tepidanaerobacter syntrophicus TaxID=224999 RepID=A0A0U9HCI1_9FIRM|nr:site-specific DNA-methyltransferase [Tepidanaerobacter syntrophicus]GAQ24365.1 adenine-specific DNA-methyltransferase [Tepidanaerobacter syntrophicus]